MSLGHGVEPFAISAVVNSKISSSGVSATEKNSSEANENDKKSVAKSSTDSSTISQSAKLKAKAMERIEGLKQTLEPDPVEQSEQNEQLDKQKPVLDQTKQDEKTSIGKEELTKSEKEQIKELEKSDKTVKAHEQAHLAAAVGLTTGGAKYSYQTGPDGKRYAIGGSVPIKVPKGKTPEETIKLNEQAKRAALAPAEPSSKDRQVANKAERNIAKAQKKLAEDAQEKMAENMNSSDSAVQTPKPKPPIDSSENSDKTTVKKNSPADIDSSEKQLSDAMSHFVKNSQQQQPTKSATSSSSSSNEPTYEEGVSELK